jgi:acyl-homoserine lactone acylase PvdQ
VACKVNEQKLGEKPDRTFALICTLNFSVMEKLLFACLLFLSLAVEAQKFAPAEVARWEAQAQRVRIVRDRWGIPHIYGQTDADAVFGLLYAQCEDDFKRVEMNYIEKLGRLAEVKGEGELYNDLLIRLVIDQAEAQADYQKAPTWLKKLLQAYADGINFYLHKNPLVKPALLARFEPWFPLLWTDGSIGAISTADVTVRELRDFYANPPKLGARLPAPAPVGEPAATPEEMLTGSNGFAFAPRITESGRAILYINPHVTFYFRPEVQVTSQEGLNAYGAVTWGQFFVYQGFNEKCGWIHTSSAADIADVYREKISQRGQQWTYEYEGRQRPVREKKIVLRYLKNGQLETKTINALFTHHGPIMAQRDGHWLSVRAQNRALTGLVQSWQRTKARSFAEFQKTMDLRANTSNNTVYADAEGNIAYWHGNFMPIRDPKFDWSKPVDGTTAATEWRGLHPVAQTVHLYNPPNGWLQNCNATPFTVAGSHSPRRADYPAYMAPDGENFRGLNAVQVLAREQKYTLDKVIAAGYDPKLVAFGDLVPALVRAFEQTVNYSDTLYAYLAGPVAVLKQWDYRSHQKSIATTLAIEWAQRLLPAVQRVAVPGQDRPDQVERFAHYARTAPAPELLRALLETVADLDQRFGRWQVPWGELNRFQRVSGDLEQPYSDAKPSLPVGFASSAWGCLPSYTSRTFPGTQKRYGVNGNSFVCAVEFGDRVRAKSLLAGGQSGDPNSPHFADQAAMYAQGQFKDVLFYPEEVRQHTEREYHPGQ